MKNHLHIMIDHKSEQLF